MQEKESKILFGANLEFRHLSASLGVTEIYESFDSFFLFSSSPFYTLK